MRRSAITTTTLALALLTALAVGGCSKKQVQQEAEISPQPEVTTPAPAPAPAPTVRETPIRQEAPPAETAAATPAPERPVTGGGMPQATTPGLQRIHFDFDQSLIRPDMKPILQQNYDYLSRNAGIQIRIEGHCDERGTTEYNLALGERRAKSAFQYLMDLGVDPNRMTVVSYGEEVPLDPRHNEEAWAKNRRDEFVETQR